MKPESSPSRKGPARPRPSFRLGDYVRVRSGVRDPNFDECIIGGWTGRVWATFEDRTGDKLCAVRWDSTTLQKILPAARKRCTRAILDYTGMDLPEDDLVRRSAPRARSDPKLSNQNLNDRIRRVFGLTAADRVPDVSPDTLLTYYLYLEKRVECPFEAVHRHRWEPLGTVSSRVTVTGILAPDESPESCLERGVICITSEGGGLTTHDVPLSLIEVEKSLPQHRLGYDYAIWFANNR
ncbi:MAG: hypothetical protein HY815_28345 [Candidatus Riflebacteria bacterium]|nr:hypothetical protein [Candidatus Riflebacteria bacterium]